MAYREPPFNAASAPARVMPEEPEFSGERFLKLPTDQRVRLCVHAAQRAHHFADTAPDSHKCFYLEIAQQWLLLADAILQESLGRSSFPPPPIGR